MGRSGKQQKSLKTKSSYLYKRVKYIMWIVCLKKMYCFQKLLKYVMIKKFM